MRLASVIAVVCAACQGSASPPPPPTTTVAPPIETAPEEPVFGDAEAPTEPPPPLFAAAEAPKEPPPRPLFAATHGGAIISVAVADDGSSALTLDTGNAVRLWPALDGTREPVAVPLVAPQDMVLARDGTGYAMAAIDTAGGLSLVRVDEAGQLIGKTAMPFDQPYARIVASADGYLALRADQTVERLDRKGTRLGVVAPGTGERIVNLVARRGRALAMVATTDGAVARWLDPANGLAWGASTAPLGIDPTNVSLSPDHLRIATLQRKTARAVIVELATSTVTPLRGHRTDLVPLDWLANDRIAFAHDEFELSRVEWFDVTGKRLASIGHDFELEFLTVLAIEAADDKVVGFMGNQLVLVTPKKLRYLGYQHHAATRLRATPAGMSIALGGSSEILDDALQIERRLPTARLHDVLPIDDTFSIAITGKLPPADEGLFDDALEIPVRRVPKTEVVLYEGTTKVQTLRLPIGDARLHYEPATRLLAVRSNTTLSVARFDPVTNRFSNPVAIKTTSKIRRVQLLDPALSGGAIALVAHGAKGALAVRTIHEDELSGASPREAVTMAGELEAIDRAGRVYLRADAATVTVHAGARQLGTLADVPKMTVRPAPDGKRVAAFGRGRVMVATADGTPLWSIGFPGVKDASWTDDELVVLANGIAKLDPATGKTLAARCGWKFGLRNHASFTETPGSTLCDR